MRFIYLQKKIELQKKLLIIILVFSLLNACKKEEEEQTAIENTYPSITINDPNEVNYNLGDTVFINIVVTDEQEMHDAEWFLILTPQNDTLWSQRKHSHGTEIIFNTYYILGTFLDQQNVNFIVKAENAFGKKSTEMRNFLILNP